jgi:hypothetical protein
MPLDADWEITGDRDLIRAELATTKADAITVPIHTPGNPTQPPNHVAATEWHSGLADKTIHEPLIWRNLEDIRIDNFHWHYSAIKDGRRIRLWGDGNYPKAKTRALKAPMVIHHWCLHRDQRTIQANREYCVAEP